MPADFIFWSSLICLTCKLNQIENEKFEMMQELRFHPPPDFNIGRCLKILPAPTFSPLSCIFSTASSHIQDAFPPNLFLSTLIWFWIMFSIVCHYINSQYQYFVTSACHCSNNLLLYKNYSLFCPLASFCPSNQPWILAAVLSPWYVLYFHNS